MRITSLQNPQVKHLKKLRSRRTRDRSGQVLIEGFREILRAVEHDYPIQDLYYCPAMFIGENEHDLTRRIAASGANIIELSTNIFGKIAYRDRPEGLIAVAPRINRRIDDLKMSDTPMLVVVEAIEKPGNLGAILRSADATGVDAMILCDPRTDLFNPNVIRASTGTIFSVQVAEAAPETTSRWLQEHNICTLAATPHTSQVYTDFDMTTPMAIIVGTEQYGLSDYWMQHANHQIKIPMLGIADSLNVANATTLLLYEAVRQRGLVDNNFK